MKALDVEQLYRRYGAITYARCRSILKNRAAAEDAVQEVFLRVIQYARSAPSEPHLVHWIASISKNHCLNRLRDERRKREAMADLPEMTHDLERALCERDLADRMVASAPEKLRSAGLLYFARGWRQHAIARALGASRRTIVKRLSAFVDYARRFSTP